MLNNTFIKSYGWTIKPIIATILILVAVVSFYVFMMLEDIFEVEKSKVSLNEKISFFQDKTTEISSKNISLPSSIQIAVLEKKLFRLNQIFFDAKSSVLVLFNKLEVIIPESIFIKEINHNGTTAKTNIIALAESVDSISVFLEKLELDRDFISVLLKRQSHIKIKNKQYIEFEISIDEVAVN